MNGKRSRGWEEEDDSNSKKRRKEKFTEVKMGWKDGNATTDVEYIEESLSEEYQPQFFNYQLIGDVAAIAILNSKDLIMKKRYYEPIEMVTRSRLCDAAWSIRDLLVALEANQESCPIGERVILSVGYTDYRTNSMNAAMLVEFLEKVIEKLAGSGCRDIIVANVPPCGMQCDSLNHWKYLQMVNDQIWRLSRKYDFVGHCDIFSLFCKRKNLFSRETNYVTGGEINYTVDFSMFDEVALDGHVDLTSFSHLGKIVLGKHVAQTVEKRVQHLRHGKVDKVICVLREASDIEDSDGDAGTASHDDDDDDPDDGEEQEVLATELKEECHQSESESESEYPCVTINLDSSDEDDRVNCPRHSDCKCEIELRLPSRQLKREYFKLDDSKQRDFKREDLKLENLKRPEWKRDDCKRENMNQEDTIGHLP